MIGKIRAKIVDSIPKIRYNSQILTHVHIKMKKSLIALSFLVAMTAYADWDNPLETFDSSKKITSHVDLKWVAVDNIQATCESESRKRGNNGFGFKLEACTFWDKTPTGYSCVMYTKKNPTTFTMGHEVRHCFQGNYH